MCHFQCCSQGVFLVELIGDVGKSEHRATLHCLLWITVLLQCLTMKPVCLVGSDSVFFLCYYTLDYCHPPQ